MARANKADAAAAWEREEFDPDTLFRLIAPRGRLPAGEPVRRKCRLLMTAAAGVAAAAVGDPELVALVAEAERLADSPRVPPDMRAGFDRLFRALTQRARRERSPAAALTESALDVLWPCAVTPDPLPEEEPLLRVMVPPDPLPPATPDNVFEQMAAADTASRRRLLGLTREVFGNPFAPPAFAPEWRTAAVVGLATTVYEERAFDRLPVLADALEEAGCADPAILTHCRAGGEHVRGCWVIDGLFGRNWAPRRRS